MAKRFCLFAECKKRRGRSRNGHKTGGSVTVSRGLLHSLVGWCLHGVSRAPELRERCLGGGIAEVGREHAGNSEREHCRTLRALRRENVDSRSQIFFVFNSGCPRKGESPKVLFLFLHGGITLLCNGPRACRNGIVMRVTALLRVLKMALISGEVRLSVGLWEGLGRLLIVTHVS